MNTDFVKVIGSSLLSLECGIVQPLWKNKNLMPRIAKLRSVCIIWILSCCLSVVLPGNLARASDITNFITPNPTLKTLMSEQEYFDFGKTFATNDSGSKVGKSIDWLLARSKAGGATFIGMAATELLWLEGEAINSGDPASDSRITAGAMSLYVLAQIFVDGEICEDQSAISFQRDKFLTHNSKVLSFLKKQMADTKKKAIEFAVLMENITLQLRGNDEALCRGGIAEISAALESGTQRDVTGTVEAGGRQGKTIIVVAPSEWRPKIVAKEEFVQRRAKKRSELRAMLEGIVAIDK